MNKLHQKLHLQHHRHTGKLLHHKHTSYRGLAVVFVLAGSLMVGVSVLGHAAADTFLGIHGTVPVAIPSAPATITIPENNATITTSTTIVAGSCPLISPQVVVAIDVDGTRAGSAMCDTNNDFSLPVTLSPGTHTLVSHTYTIAGDHGPDGDPVYITDTSPVAVNTSGSDTGGPIVISADQPFTYLSSDRTALWTGTISGGTAPYNVVINSGDKTQEEYTEQAGKQHFSHIYGTLQPYNMTFYVTDANGKSVTEQFALAAYTVPSGSVSNNGNGAGTGSITTTGNTPPGASTTIGLYGFFLTVLSVCAIIWLEAKHTLRHTGTRPVTT